MSLTISQPSVRDTRFSIIKALAIILVVLSHAGVSGWFYNFIFLFHVPVFFICAGYFFHTKYLSGGQTFVWHRVKGLYLPFVRWSVFLLVVHNLLFSLGILSETYGNAKGGVTHPYTWHQWCQHLWSIVTNMSGYDPFLGGTFWFFRALLLSSLGFFILFKLLRLSERLQKDIPVGWGILSIALLLALWQTCEGLTMTGVAQGGYRELMGIAFMAAGFLIRQYGLDRLLTWKVVVPAALVTGLFAWLCPTAMVWRATVGQFFALPLPALGGFLLLAYAAMWLDRWEGVVKRVAIYVGDRTLYVFAFHLMAFKVVGLLKVWWYDLPLEALGGHPYVLQPANNLLWILLYLIIGVALPVLWMMGYRLVAARVNVNFSQQRIFGWLIQGGQLVFRLLRFIVKGFWNFLVRQWRGLVHGFRELLAASSPKDE